MHVRLVASLGRSRDACRANRLWMRGLYSQVQRGVYQMRSGFPNRWPTIRAPSDALGLMPHARASCSVSLPGLRALRRATHALIRAPDEFLPWQSQAQNSRARASRRRGEHVVAAWCAVDGEGVQQGILPPGLPGPTRHRFGPHC